MINTQKESFVFRQNKGKPIGHVPHIFVACQWLSNLYDKTCVWPYVSFVFLSNFCPMKNTSGKETAQKR